MPFWTYILDCADRSYYTGHTDDLEKRLAQHQSGAIRGYTYERRPVELVWCEDFPTREEALSAEVRIKNWSRAKKEALIAKDWERLKRFSRPPSERLGLANARHSPSTSLGRNGNGDMEELSSVPPELVEGLIRAKREPSSTHTPPIIVLVRPQLGENIGKAARAMLNFGLVELRLVAPRDGWPNPDAGPAASGADQVLEQAQVFATVAEAVADCAHVYATTVRKRGVTKPVLTPEQAAREIPTQQGRSAILFGPERSGLETEDVTLARAILTVPINPEFGSLNLAQAVILVAYEWSKHRDLAMPPREELLPPAPQEELEGLIGHFEELLEAQNYFFPHSRAETTRLTLRNLLTKPGWNHLEIRTLRGVLSSLSRQRRNGSDER
jgi:tRNA/rRNA methyltransferase